MNMFVTGHSLHSVARQEVRKFLYVSLQDEIISKLKEHLLVKGSLAYEPLLDLLVQFARDIQSEFYPYFEEMFPILVGMCDCQDADLIQVCHSY